jgi:uncharacterized Tic20 family protein
MVLRNSESRELTIYCTLIFLLAMVLPWVVIIFLPISFFFLAALCTQKNQHYNVPLNLKIISRRIVARAPPTASF